MRRLPSALIADPQDRRHGTPAGVKAHRVAGIEPCEHCRWAERTVVESYGGPRPPEEHAWNQVDPMVVERILGGDWKLKATRAEKEAVCAQWARWGYSFRQLNLLTGWKPERYFKIREAA